jgi:hypothetical protein
MEKDKIQSSLPLLLSQVIALDVELQQSTIDVIYDTHATFTNPYMTLQGRQLIKDSYRALSLNNIHILIIVESVTFDLKSLKVMADIEQKLTPKALGGLIQLKYTGY